MSWRPWLASLSLGVFIIGLYGGYLNGGTGGFASAWLAAGGLTIAALATERGPNR